MMNILRKSIGFAIAIALSIAGYSQSKILKSFDDTSAEITQMKISDDTRYLSAGNKLGIVTLWDYSTGKEIFKVRNHKEPISFIFYHPTRDELVTADENEVLFSNLSDGTVVSRIGIFEDIQWMDVSPVDDVVFILASQRGVENSKEIYKVDLTSRKFENFYSASGISMFKVSPDGKQLFMTKGNDMDFVNINLQIVEKQFDDHLSKIRTIDINPADPAWMLTTDRSLVRYWQTSSGKNIPIHWSVKHAFLVDDSKILTADEDTVMMRDYKVTNYKKILKLSKSGIEDVMVSFDRTLAFVLTNTNKIEVYGTEIVPHSRPQTVAKVNKPIEKTNTSNQTASNVPKVELKDGDQAIYAKYKTEIEAEIALKAELFKPRGEFEKSSDYETRMAEAKSYKDGIIEYYRDKHIRAQELEKQLALAKQRYMDSLARMDDERRQSLYREKIRDSYEEFQTSIESIGTYNADKEEFPVTIDGITQNVNVPIDHARGFKEDYEKAKVVAARQLLDDATTKDVFNVKIVDPNSHLVYDFGKQKEPLYIVVKKEQTLLASILNANTQRSAIPVEKTEEVALPEKGSVEQQMAQYLKQKNYYALLIGVGDYIDPKINKLDNPVNDALRLKRVLQNDYTFQEENIILLKNPTRTEIIESFDELAKKINKEDNLVIFYAGHGIWDERLKQGYWLPKDSKQDSKAAWLSNGTIRDYVGGIKSKHTLLIADACFSGGIFKTREVFTDAKAVRELYKLPSRKAMTSGNMKTVPDKSVFMDYLIKRLQNNQQSIISAEQLFSSFRVAVINNSANGQVPQYGDIREAGDEGGDFVFLRRE